jgi:hypothetical protein
MSEERANQQNEFNHINDIKTFTISSYDSNDYGTVHVNINYNFDISFIRVSLSSFVTNCNIVVLQIDDYIEFEIDGEGDVKLIISDDYTNIESTLELSTILNDHMTKQNINITTTSDNAGRLSFVGGVPFKIKDMSYNIKLLTGFYSDDVTYPLNCYAVADELNKYAITATSVGYLMSTPVLYLLSSLGSSSYINKHDSEMTGVNIFAKINNTFSPRFPITSSYSELSILCSASSVTDFKVQLVDANLIPIKILNPIYSSFTIEKILTEINTIDMILNQQMEVAAQQQQMNQKKQQQGG